MWWGVVVALHAGVALSIAFILANQINGPPIWWWYPVGAVVVTLMLHLGLQFTTPGLPDKDHDSWSTG